MLTNNPETWSVKSYAIAVADLGPAPDIETANVSRSISTRSYPRLGHGQQTGSRLRSLIGFTTGYAFEYDV